jgi:mRNA interferase MazF
MKNMNYQKDSKNFTKVYSPRKNYAREYEKDYAPIKRGDIYYADLSPATGSEQGGMRPVVIIQNDKGNLHSPTVIAAAITSQNKRGLPTHIELVSERFGLSKNSTIMLEQIRTIDKTRLRDKIGHLDSETMEKVNRAIFISFGINIELLNQVPGAPASAVSAMNAENPGELSKNESEIKSPHRARVKIERSPKMRKHKSGLAQNELKKVSGEKTDRIDRPEKKKTFTALTNPIQITALPNLSCQKNTVNPSVIRPYLPKTAKEKNLK